MAHCDCLLFCALEILLLTYLLTYMRAHSMRNSNHILHGDQTRCEENIYPVDHEC